MPAAGAALKARSKIARCDIQLPLKRHAHRFGLRVVCGYAMSETTYGTVWAHGTRPYGTLGSIRQHPTLGRVNEGRVMRDGRPLGAGAGLTGRLMGRSAGRLCPRFDWPIALAPVAKRL